VSFRLFEYSLSIMTTLNTTSPAADEWEDLEDNLLVEAVIAYEKTVKIDQHSGMSQLNFIY
jgi:hypothetical protein